MLLLAAVRKENAAEAVAAMLEVGNHIRDFWKLVKEFYARASRRCKILFTDVVLL